MRTVSLNGPAMMDLGHCEKLHRQGISEACHPTLEAGGAGEERAPQRSRREHLEKYNWDTAYLTLAVL